MSEIPTARLRTLNVGLAAATQWLINFVIARTTLTMMSTMGFVRPLPPPASLPPSPQYVPLTIFANRQRTVVYLVSLRYRVCALLLFRLFPDPRD